MTAASSAGRFAIRHEVHFDGRVLPCYADRPWTLDAMLRRAVEASPGADALVCDGRTLDYATLDRRVAGVAAGFAALGVRSRDRVALLLGNCLEFPIALLAAARLGAITVPMSPRGQRPEVEYALTDCGAVVILYDPAFADRLPEAVAVPALRHRIAIDEGRFADWLAEPPSPPPPSPAGEEDVAVILYTSGTTGRPKGAMLTNLNIAHSVRHYEQVLGLGPADRAVLAVPTSHVTGLVGHLLTMLHIGGASLILPSFEVGAFLDLAASQRMTYTMLVPAMYTLCLMRADLAQYDLSAWRIGAYGGAVMAPATIADLARRLPGLILVNAYGATETTSPATIAPLGSAAARSDSVGKAVPCGSLRVVDDEGRDVPPGDSGEIWIAGAMVVPGYWNDPEATRTNFTDGYWRSGDIGSLDAEGWLRVLDRKKDMINRGGYKIYSAEVENCLAAHPAIVEAAIVGRPCPVLGERSHAFVASRDPALTAGAVKAWVAKRLADYKVPDGVTLVDTPLPRNANGKLLKRELRARAIAETA
jgi:long-chain acyl-CoA synthetase